MSPRRDAAHALTRRRFLACCSALAAAGAGCASLAPDMRSAYALIVDPPLADYEPILRALIGTVLPLDVPAFPVTGQQVKDRLLRLFRLECDPRFLLLQRSFMLFDQTDLFPHFAPLTREEKEEGRSTKDEGEAHDRDLYARFAAHGAPARFTALPLDRQREYFDLWRQSRFLLRREFHATARSLVMVSAYSMPETWAAIGYAGPLLPGHGGARS
jgi:phage tail protein X